MNSLLVRLAACLVCGEKITLCTVAVLILHHPLTLSELVSTPMNTVSVVGRKTKIECSRNPHPSYPIDWKFSPAGSSNFSYIYANGRITESLSSRYKIETDNRSRYDIVIDSVDLSHAGTYRCTPITDGESKSASAELTVLASDPVCNTNATVLKGYIAEDEYIQMLCLVNYSGNWIPVMEWIRENRIIVDAGIIYTNTSTDVASSLTTQLVSNDNGASFTSKTTVNRTSNKNSKKGIDGDSPAINVPQYRYLWNFKPNVSYAPRNLTILPMNNSYKVGERLVCSAKGNPDPSYEWAEVETNITSRGSDLTISDSMSSDKNHNFRCTAYNNVNGYMKHASKTVTFTVTIPGRSGFTTDHYMYIIIAIIVVGAACCFVLTLYLCNNRCPYKRDMVESLDDHTTGRLWPAEALCLPGFQGGNLQQQLPLPVYAEVHKKGKNDDFRPVYVGATGNLPKQTGLAVYTAVTKNRNGSRHPDSPRQTAEANASQYRPPPSKVHTYPGADGTQYMDVTSIHDLNARAPSKHPPMFSLVETYASIDHTVNAPPPPLPPKRQ